MSLAIAYAMKRKKKSHEKGVHKPVSGEGSEKYPGMSEAGEDYRDSKSSQKEYYLPKAKEKHLQVLGEMIRMGKKDRKYLADGGTVEEGFKKAFKTPEEIKAAPKPTPMPEHEDTNPATRGFKKAFKKPGYAEGGHVSACKNCGYAEGGEVEKDYEAMEEASGYDDFPEEHEKHNAKAEDDEQRARDLVEHIMEKRMGKYSEGGRVANDVGDGMDVDEKENQFDDLVLRDDLESSYTGEDSGDEIGNEQEDEDRHDVVKQIMMSRKKKDKMPRPA